MVRSPSATLTSVAAQPRSLDLAALILLISALCSVGFLLTGVGRLAALDQEVRQLESLGTFVDPELYERIRATLPYRPAVTAAGIIVGWPILWALAAVALRSLGNLATGRHATFAQVFAVIVHASSVLALRAVVSAPLNFAREAIGGATSLGVLIPGLGESTFVARLLGAVDMFALWWIVLVAMGLSIVYHTRAFPVARWLFGAYAAGAAALALTQALRGGI